MITRPRERAVRLAALIEQAGARALIFPALEIVAPGDLPALHALVDRLDEFDFAVFVSPTAAVKGMELVCSRRGLPPAVRIAAVGRGTARELRRLGVEAVLVPADRADSEALLALRELQDVASRSVLVFRGTGGRELLADTLRRRGAVVEYAQCYRRERPAADAQELLRSWERGAVDATTLTSREALDNLVEMVGPTGAAWLRATPMFVPHERIAAAARRHGVVDVHVTASGDEALVDAMARHFAASP